MKKTSITKMTDDEIMAFIEKYDTAGKVKWLDRTCAFCGRQMNSWDERIQHALGFGCDECESCMAAEYGMTVEGFRDRMKDEFGLLPCKGI